MTTMPQISATPPQGRLSDTMNIGQLCQFVSPITNVHVNSLGGMLHEIRNSEALHWMEGLRCAELFVKQQQESLQANYMQQRKMERQLVALNGDIEVLQIKMRQWESKKAQSGGVVDQSGLAQAEFALEGERIFREIEAKKDRIETIEFTQKQTIPMVRDAVMLTAAALGERERIIADHPESTEMEFIELQQIYTGQIIQERQAKYIAARTMNLSETAAAAILDVPPSYRDEVFRRAAIHRNGVDSAQALSDLAVMFAIGGYGEDCQKGIIQQAAQIVNPPPTTPAKRWLRRLVEMLP